MKKLLFIALAFALTASVTQTATAQQSTNSGAMKAYSAHPELDSVTNTETLTIYKSVAGYQDIVTVQALFTRISGTVAGTAVLSGTVYPEGSTGTLPWEPIDTFTLSNSASQSAVLKVPSGEHRYAQYKLVMSGGTTTVYTVKAYLLPRIAVVLPKN